MKKTIMKKIIYLVLIGILILSCSHDDNSINHELTGNWNWVKSSGGISYHIETPESTGKTVKLEITNNTIKRYVNGNLDYESNYSIVSEKENGVQLQIITFDDQIIPLQITSLNESTLKLSEYKVDDGFQYEYLRE